MSPAQVLEANFARFPFRKRYDGTKNFYQSLRDSPGIKLPSLNSPFK